MKRLVLIGNLGQDAKIISINEREYISFNVASTEKKGGQEKTTWVSCLSSNVKLLEYLQKGKKVYVRGSFEVEIFTPKEGGTQANIKMLVDQLELC